MTVTVPVLRTPNDERPRRVRIEVPIVIRPSASTTHCIAWSLCKCNGAENAISRTPTSNPAKVTTCAAAARANSACAAPGRIAVPETTWSLSSESTGDLFTVVTSLMLI